MKSTIQNKIESQFRGSIRNENLLKIMSMQKRKSTIPIVYHHPNFGGAGSRFSTGPPGRAPGLGMGYDLFPEHPPDKKRCRTDKILQVHLET